MTSTVKTPQRRFGTELKNTSVTPARTEVFASPTHFMSLSGAENVQPMNKTVSQKKFTSAAAVPRVAQQGNSAPKARSAVVPVVSQPDAPTLKAPASSTLDPHPNSFFAHTPIKTSDTYNPPQKYSKEFLLAFKPLCQEKPKFFCGDLILAPFLVPRAPVESPAFKKAEKPLSSTNISPKAAAKKPLTKVSVSRAAPKNNNNNNNNNNNTVNNKPVPISSPAVAVPAPSSSAKPPAASLQRPKTAIATKTSSDKHKRETDAKRLLARQKQIDIGMNTVGYKNFMRIFERLNAEQKLDTNLPRVPNKFQICSKRSWDGQVRKWRRMLHLYDDPATDSVVIPSSDILAEDEIDENDSN